MTYGLLMEKTFPRYVCGYKLGIYYEIDLPIRIILIEYYKGESSWKRRKNHRIK